MRYDCKTRQQTVLTCPNIYKTHVEVAPVLVANTAVALVAITTVSARARNEPKLFAGVRCVGSRDRVGLPEIHLSAARAQFSATSILIIGAGFPTLGIRSTVDPFDVVRALRVTVAFDT